MAAPCQIRPLLLAGGKSTRMGAPKHLLRLPSGDVLYQQQLDLLRAAIPNAPTVYISLAQDSALDSFLQSLPSIPSLSPSPLPPPPVAVIHDLQPTSSPDSSGPSSGLLAAHYLDPAATWLVIAVDYSLLTVSVLQRLLTSYEPPVTCFRNEEGFCEPLLGVWGPEALKVLADMSEQGGGAGSRSPGPCKVVKRLGGKMIDVAEENRGKLRGFNTKKEWETVSRCLKAEG
jgi:molybdenum cofactor guanylyltransferase